MQWPRFWAITSTLARYAQSFRFRTHARYPIECPVRFCLEFVERHPGRVRQHPKDDVSAGEPRCKTLLDDRLHSASHQVSRHRVAYRFRDDKPESGGLICADMQNRVGDAVRTTHAVALTNDVSIVICPSNSMMLRWHSRPQKSRDYAVSFARPLPRRAEMMARPARVRIRARKPCTLARRRLLG